MPILAPTALLGQGYEDLNTGAAPRACKDSLIVFVVPTYDGKIGCDAQSMPAKVSMSILAPTALLGQGYVFSSR